MLSRYIGGEFCEADAVPLTGDKQVDAYFPEYIRDTRRFYFETGTDALAYILFGISHQQTIDLWVPENFCYTSLDHLIIKLNAQGISCRIRRYTSFDEPVSAAGAIPILLYLHFNRFDPPPREVLSSLERRGFTIVEDFVHAPLHLNRLSGHHGFNSLRKFGPHEVSIAYTCNNAAECSGNRSEYYRIRKQASELKSEFLADNDKAKESEYLRLFAKAEEMQGVPGIFLAQEEEIDRISRTDFSLIMERRKSNFKNLIESLPMELEVLPGEYMYAMVRTGEQATLRKYCFENGIFPAIHWLDSNSALSKSLLSFHIDQRYNTGDMERLAAVLSGFYKQ